MKDSFVTDEMRYQLLKAIESNPNTSQRELAKVVGVSLGKTNYCLRALVESGWIKAGNFARSSNKAEYAYILTPSGFKEKAKVTIRFLENKLNQYEQLKEEIDFLKKEIGSDSF